MAYPYYQTTIVKAAAPPLEAVAKAAPAPRNLAATPVTDSYFVVAPPVDCVQNTAIALPPTHSRRHCKDPSL